MNVSSRTPEGVPHRCPVCGKETNLEVSTVSADATCASCGSLLWLKWSGRRPGQTRAAAPAKVKALGAIAAVALVVLGVFGLAAFTFARAGGVFGLGTPELIVLGIMAITLFGRQLPEVAKSLGQAVVHFRTARDEGR